MIINKYKKYTSPKSVNYIQIYLVSLILFTLYRGFFYYIHKVYFKSINPTTLIKAFLAGVSYDSLAIASGLLIIYLLSAFIGWGTLGKKIINFFISFYLFFIALFTLFDIPHFKIYDGRFNSLIIQQFDNVVPIAQSIWDNFPVMWILPIILLFYYFIIFIIGW